MPADSDDNANSAGVAALFHSATASIHPTYMPVYTIMHSDTAKHAASAALRAPEWTNGTYMRFATARNPLTRMLANSVNEPNDSIDSVGRVNSKNANSGRPRSSSRHSAAKHSMTNPMP